MSQRRRFKQHLPLQDRLAEWAKEVLSMSGVSTWSRARRPYQEGSSSRHCEPSGRLGQVTGLQPPR